MQPSERSRDHRAATALAGSLALVAAVTGVALMFGVSAHDTARAVDRVRATALGSALHDLHTWASHGLVAGAVLWLLAAFPAAAYRRRSWPTAVVLVAAVVAFVATGVALVDLDTTNGDARALYAAHCALLPALALAAAIRSARLERRPDDGSSASSQTESSPRLRAATEAGPDLPTSADSSAS